MTKRYPPWLGRVAWLAVIAWAAAVFYLSSLPGDEIEKIGVHLWDKASHFIAFGAGAAVLTFALRVSTGWSWPRIALIAVLAIALYGATDEYHQLYTPRRSGGDLQDWLADSLGGILGAVLTISIYALAQRSHRPPPARN